MEDGLRIGLLRQAIRGGARNLLRQSSERAAQRRGPLLVPQPNDTISDDYWAKVNRALHAEGLRTPPPSTLNDPLPTPTPEPWKKIFTASEKVNVLDSEDAVASLSDWTYATPQPFSTNADTAHAGRTMGVVPYDMQIGAHIMYGLSAKATATPPPTQEFVDEAFMAQCPMVMFSSNSLTIRPPRCDNPYGDWSDSTSDRIVLRWKDNRKGGLYFGVDSVVNGEGSAKFADYSERFSFKSYLFELRNCMNVMRYVVEEQIIKVNHMAPGARSTMLEHDVTRSSEAYFYRYTLSQTNGSIVAETNLYRMDQSEVNFTLYSDELGNGAIFAVAKREGRWQRDQWRECKYPNRAWTIEFPLVQANFSAIATAQDLRVAAAATVTLMAYRDEQVGYDGFQHVGQGHMYFTLVRTVFLVLFALVVFCIGWIVIVNQQLDKRMQRFCFRLETIILPKRPVKIHKPVLHPTY